MERPLLIVSKESRGTKHMFRIEISAGCDPGSNLEREFSEISGRYSLTPEGGCYEAMARTMDGPTIHFLGGMYVQPEKLNSVLADLRTQGYTIELRSAA